MDLATPHKVGEGKKQAQQSQVSYIDKSISPHPYLIHLLHLKAIQMPNS